MRGRHLRGGSRVAAWPAVRRTAECEACGRPGENYGWLQNGVASVCIWGAAGAGALPGEPRIRKHFGAHRHAILRADGKGEDVGPARRGRGASRPRPDTMRDAHGPWVLGESGVNMTGEADSTGIYQEAVHCPTELEESRQRFGTLSGWPDTVRCLTYLERPWPAAITGLAAWDRLHFSGALSIIRAYSFPSLFTQHTTDGAETILGGRPRAVGPRNGL